MGSLGRTLFGLLGVLLLFVSSSAPIDAGEERFDYDPLGRLIRTIDEQGRVTEYVYDPVGNLLEVIGGGTVAPPVLTGFTPESLRRGESKQFVATGTGLTGVRITAANPGLSVSAPRVTATEARFTLSADADALLGPQPILFENAAGSTTAAVTLNPVLPGVTVVPAPLAIPPDSTTRQFTIRLSSPDNIAHSIALSVKDATVATVTPATLTLVAGQTEVKANITGLKAGQTTIVLASTTLGDTLVPVFVTAEFRGVNTSFAPLLGVVVEALPQPKPPTTITPFGAPHLGVVLGAYIQAINPRAVTIGTGPVDLTVTGKGLAGVTSVAVVPADGITLGTPSANADGTALTVPVTVAADAPTTMRQLVLKAGTQVVPPAHPEADRFYVARPAPEVTSVDPLFVVPGTPSQALFIRGKNLQGLERIAVSPTTGITVDANPSVNANGTEITVKIAVSPAAPLGPRVVSVTTVGGSSSATGSPANTFTVVNELKESYTPITSALVGVVKEAEAAPPATQALGLNAVHLGVTVGSVVTGVSPAAGSIGDTLTLTVTGYELQNATALKFLPETGVTVGTPTVAADGKSLTAQIVLAADAPQTLRAVQVFAGTTLLPVSSPSATQFRVTAPLPEVYSVSPLYLQVGQSPASFVVRGKNFQNLQQVKILPPDGVTVGSSSINADSTEITVNVSAAATAALGTRVLAVETAAGATSSTGTVANTVTLTDKAGTNYTPILAPALGVVKQTPAPPAETPIGPISAVSVGVVLESELPPPASTSLFLKGTTLGVALGPVGLGVAPAGLPVGTSGTLLVQGYALNDVTAVSLSPADGITLGTPTVNAAGTELSVPITVAADAPAGWREMTLNTATGKVPFADTARGRFYLGTGVPSLDSIEPILATQGTTLTLIVRGQNLQNATAMTATPPDGVQLTFPITVNATGTQLTVPMYIAPDAPLSSRVIRVVTPAGTSDEIAVPANTFTVYPP